MSMALITTNRSLGVYVVASVQTWRLLSHRNPSKSFRSLLRVIRQNLADLPVVSSTLLPSRATTAFVVLLSGCFDRANWRGVTNSPRLLWHRASGHAISRRRSHGRSINLEARWAGPS